jgi:hypothetical protein
MTHAIDCPACGGHLKIPDGIWEKRVQGQLAHLNCKKCKHPIEVDGRTEEQKAAAAGEAGWSLAPPPEPERAKPEAPKADATPSKPEAAEGSKPDHPKPALPKLELQPRRPEIRPKAEIAQKLELRGARADVTPRPLDVRGSKPDITAKLPDVALKPDRGSKPDITAKLPDVAPKPDRGSKPDITPKPADVRGSKPDLRGSKPDITPKPADVRGSKPDLRGSKPDITPKPADARPKLEITAKLPEVAAKPERGSKPDVDKSDALAPKPVEPRALGKPLVSKLAPPPDRQTKPETPKPALRESTPDTPLAKLGIKSDPPPESIPADSADIIDLPASEPLPRFPPPKPAEARKTLPERDPPPKPAAGGKKPPPKPEVIRESDVGEPPKKSERPKKASDRPKASERPKAPEEKRRSVRPVALDSTDRNVPVVAAETPSARKGRGLTIALIVAAAVAVGWWVLRPRAQAPVRPEASPPAIASVAPSATPTPPSPTPPTAEASPTPPSVEPPTPPAAESERAEEPKKKKRRSVAPPGTRYVPSSI